jgi:hypothetical protein
MTQAANAKTWAYRGLMELDQGSSIPGIPRYSRYDVDFTPDGSILDTDDSAWENGFENGNGVRGISSQGSFATPFVSLRFTKDPTGPATLDLSELFFDDTTRGAAIAKDANHPPIPTPVFAVAAPAPLNTSTCRSATQARRRLFTISFSISTTARCMPPMAHVS